MKVYDAIKEMLENNKTIQRNGKYSYNWFYKMLKTDIGDLIVYQYGAAIDPNSWKIGSFSFDKDDINSEYEIVENKKGENDEK